MTSTALYALSAAVPSLTMVIANEVMTPSQQWSVIGLLAVVVVGIGGRLVKALDTNTKVLAHVGKHLALLRQKNGMLDESFDELRSEVRGVPTAIIQALEQRKAV